MQHVVAVIGKSMCEIHLNDNRTPGLPADLLLLSVFGYGAMVISDPTCDSMTYRL